MAKILWHGDAGCSSGFARVTHEICKRLVDDHGHEVEVLGINFRGDPDYRYLPFPIYPPNLRNYGDVLGYSRVVELLNKVEPDVFVVFNDVPIIMEVVEIIKSAAAKNMLTCPPFAVLGFFPVDCENLPPIWGKTIKQLDVAVTYTDWAREQVLKVDPTIDLSIVGHGGSDAFYSVSSTHPVVLMNGNGQRLTARCKEDVKLFLGLKDKFVVLWADRNSPRKAPAVFFREAAPFIKAHDDAVIWMHCAKDDVGGDIAYLIDRFGLEGKVYTTTGVTTFSGIPESELNALYNAADVKVSTSMGEGWGLTNHEALLTGTPVICMDNSVNKEVLGPGAYYLDKGYPFTTERAVDLWFPVVGQYTAALEDMYRNGGRRVMMGAQGRKHIQRYTWEKAATAMNQAVGKAMTIRDANVEGAL